MIGVILVLVLLGYANAADERASEKLAQFWRQPTPAQVVAEVDRDHPPQRVQRFGYQFGVQGE